MDSAGWILIILIIGVVAMLIYLNNRSEPTLEPESPESPPTPKPPESTPQKEEKKYVTIYEYTPARLVKKCAYCDGENAYDTKVCRICGNDIDS